jgi:hypothetical protein
VESYAFYILIATADTTTATAVVIAVVVHFGHRAANLVAEVHDGVYKGQGSVHGGPFKGAKCG